MMLKYLIPKVVVSGVSLKQATQTGAAHFLTLGKRYWLYTMKYRYCIIGYISCLLTWVAMWSKLKVCCNIPVIRTYMFVKTASCVEQAHSIWYLISICVFYSKFETAFGKFISDCIQISKAISLHLSELWLQILNKVIIILDSVVGYCSCNWRCWWKCASTWGIRNYMEGDCTGLCTCFEGLSRTAK
jgi:hypothetical protein